MARGFLFFRVIITSAVANKKKILYIDLATKLVEAKLHADLDPYIGGLGFALKISADLKDRKEKPNRFILATGPLSGFFPGCDRAISYFKGKKLYLDGAFAVDLKRAGYYGLSIYNTSEKPYYLVVDDDGARFGDAGLLSTLSVEEKYSWLREHELNSGSLLVMPEEYYSGSNFVAMVVNTTEELVAPDSELLQKTLQRLWGEKQVSIVSTEQARWGDSWKPIEITQQQVLLDSLAANEQTANIYGQIPVAFACLEAVGETRTHEELEGLSDLYSDLNFYG